jgi:hypothetical protein
VGLRKIWISISGTRRAGDVVIVFPDRLSTVNRVLAARLLAAMQR